MYSGDPTLRRNPLTSRKASSMDRPSTIGEVDRNTSKTAFEAAVSSVPEVVECYLMTGGSDYLLRLVVRDVDDLERVHAKALTTISGVTRVSSSVAMRTVVKRGALPV